MTDEQIRHQKETKMVIDYYLKMISTGTEENRFRSCFYNKISKLPAE